MLSSGKANRCSLLQDNKPPVTFDFAGEGLDDYRGLIFYPTFAASLLILPCSMRLAT